MVEGIINDIPEMDESTAFEEAPMDLVNELQISAEKDDVLTVLRKTKRLASKLDRRDISEWLKFELEGYLDGKSVPDYRQIRATVAMNTNGNVPAGFGFVMNGIQDLPGFGINPVLPLMDSVSTVLAMIESLAKGHGIFLPLDRRTDPDKYLRSHVDPMFKNQVSFLLHLNGDQVKAIPERIKDKVLDWSCALEAAGIKGEGFSFNEKEKQIANSITFNISHSNIEQLTNTGSNQKG